MGTARAQPSCHYSLASWPVYLLCCVSHRKPLNKYCQHVQKRIARAQSLLQHAERPGEIAQRWRREANLAHLGAMTTDCVAGS